MEPVTAVICIAAYLIISAVQSDTPVEPEKPQQNIEQVQNESK